MKHASSMASNEEYAEYMESRRKREFRTFGEQQEHMRRLGCRKGDELELFDDDDELYPGHERTRFNGALRRTMAEQRAILSKLADPIAEKECVDAAPTEQVELGLQEYRLLGSTAAPLAFLLASCFLAPPGFRRRGPEDG